MLHRRHVVPGVLLHPFLGPGRVIGLLEAQVGIARGDLPVAHAARKMLFVKFEICAVPGITHVAAPDLRTGDVVPGEKWDVRGMGQVGGIRVPRQFVRRLVGALKFLPEELQAGKTVEVDALGFPSLEEMGVDEEIADALLAQDLVDAETGIRRFVFDRGFPVVAGPVGALGDPKSPGLPAEVLAVGVTPLPDLLADAFVPGEKREIAMRRRRCQDLDMAAVLEGPECVDDVAVAPAMEIVEDLPVPGLPKIGERTKRAVPRPLEIIAVTDGDRDLHSQVLVETPGEAGILELFHQDRGEADVRPGGDPFAGQPLEDVEERYVCFRGGLVEPVHPVRPTAVGQDVGDVAVKDERKVLIRHDALSRRCSSSFSHSRPKPTATPGKNSTLGGLYQNPLRIGRVSAGRRTRRRPPPRARTGDVPRRGPLRRSPGARARGGRPKSSIPIRTSKRGLFRIGFRFRSRRGARRRRARSSS